MIAVDTFDGRSQASDRVVAGAILDRRWRDIGPTYLLQFVLSYHPTMPRNDLSGQALIYILIEYESAIAICQ
jgi:hypothetical protein